jgi:plastocyanin
MQRRTFLAGAGFAASGLSGCLGVLGTDGGLSEDDYDVGMSHNAFEPAEFTVSVGDTVVWGNPSSRSHTVTAYDSGIPEGGTYFASGGFDSESAAREGWQRTEGAIRASETYEHTFETAGRYEYLCIPHESSNMVGTIVVE